MGSRDLFECPLTCPLIDNVRDEIIDYIDALLDSRTHYGNAYGELTRPERQNLEELFDKFRDINSTMRDTANSQLRDLKESYDEAIEERDEAIEERDGAVDDAIYWRRAFESLEEAFDPLEEELDEARNKIDELLYELKVLNELRQ